MSLAGWRPPREEATGRRQLFPIAARSVARANGPGVAGQAGKGRSVFQSFPVSASLVSVKPGRRGHAPEGWAVRSAVQSNGDGAGHGKRLAIRCQSVLGRNIGWCPVKPLTRRQIPARSACARMVSATSMVLTASRNGEEVTSRPVFRDSMNSRFFAWNPPETNVSALPATSCAWNS